MYAKILYFIILGILTFVVTLIVTDFFEESASPSVYLSLLILGMIVGALGYYIYDTDFNNTQVRQGEYSDNSTTPVLVPEQQYVEQSQPFVPQQTQSYVPQQTQSYVPPQPHTEHLIDKNVKYFTKVNELNKNIKKILKKINK